MRDIVHAVEFKVHSSPNDMKMLAFLAGKLSHSASYFTTFAKDNKIDANNVNKRFSLDGKSEWKTYSYEQRLLDAKASMKRKQELNQKNIKPATMRSNLTTYISTNLHSRQEENPLVENYVDLARAEPLHLKNNVAKKMFRKILAGVLSQSKIAKTVKYFRELPDENLFVEFLNHVRTNMNSNVLAKRLKIWFNENRERKQEKLFAFRFCGKESFNYLQGFPALI